VSGRYCEAAEGHPAVVAVSYGLAIFRQHAAMLEASNIDPDRAQRRGYKSMDTKKHLESIGIAKTGRNVPGLLVPLLRQDGGTWGWQYRPDQPRVNAKGKPVKYETPVGQRNGIDVPPGVGEQLGDPAVPLWITEGVKKADAGAAAGLCIVALPGVWSWIGRNAKGGKVAVPDWRDIALNDRRIVLAFDSDVVRKKPVRHALDELASYLGSKGAEVEFLHLPDDEDGKTGLDDYLADGHTADDLRRLVRPQPPALTEPEANAPVVTPQPLTVATANPDVFFGGDGLQVRKLARAVAEQVTYGWGRIDQRFYTYRNGLWRAGDEELNRHITRLLGDRYRRSHGTNVLDVLQYGDQVRAIDSGPVPRWINVTNGLIDWSDGTLYPHTPDALSVTQLPVEYHQDADCPRFRSFVNSVLPEDCVEPTSDSPHGFIWELIAYAIYSGNPFHVAVLLYGTGRNGKGVFLHTLERLLGATNVSSVTLHDLIGNRFRAATLFGKLANIAGDLDAKWLDGTAMFKAVTGGDSVQAERKYGAAFDFTPWALPIFSTNRAFGAADTSEGYFARWVVVPFPHSFVGREDRHLEGRLGTDEELRGILRRAVAALPTLMARGRLPEPASVAEAKRAFIVAGDRVRAWLDEDARLDPDAWTPRSALFNAFRSYAEGGAGKPLSASEFYQRLGQVVGVRAAKRGVHGFVGVRLLDHRTEGAQGAGLPLPNASHGEKGVGAAPSAPCTVCGDPLHLASRAGGHTTHPTCDPEVLPLPQVPRISNTSHDQEVCQ
jgi:P4 family phage/plasmid primase-like protien